MPARAKAVHPIKGRAELVIRALFSSPDYVASGRDLSRSLNISQSWINKVLAALEANGFVQRNKQGPASKTTLINPTKLLKRWTLEYQIELNTYNLYFDKTESPLITIPKIAKKEDLQYALTGYAAANLIEKTVYGEFPPMIYLWPGQSNDQSFEDMLLKLENIYRLMPVKKHANMILLQPIQKDRVFFEMETRRNLNIVSPLQLFLDLYSLDRGEFVIKELKKYWDRHGIPYAI